jgi:hypothetical protein
MYDHNCEPNARITFSSRNPRNDIHREVELRIRERMSADAKLTYSDAMRATFAADADLHNAYLDSAPPRRFTANQE